MNYKQIISGIIAIIIVAGAVASLFFPTNELGSRLLQNLSTLIIGYYFGTKDYPLSAYLHKDKTLV